MSILHSVLNVKAVVPAFNQEKVLVGAFSVITNIRMELFEALLETSKVTVPLSSTQDQLQHSATTRLMRLDGTQRIFSISDNGPLYCQFHFLF